MTHPQPVKSSNLDKSRMIQGGLHNENFCKKIKYPQRLGRNVNFHFYHYKTMETLSCHRNQSSYLTKINQRTIGPVNAHLIYMYWPSKALSGKAQKIQNLENIW